jgi:hypothetical protein
MSCSPVTALKTASKSSRLGEDKAQGICDTDLPNIVAEGAIEAIRNGFNIKPVSQPAQRDSSRGATGGDCSILAKTVTDVALSQDVCRLSRVVLNLLSQLIDDNAQIFALIAVERAPDRAQ